MYHIPANSHISCNSCGEVVGFMRSNVVVADFLYCEKCEKEGRLHVKHQFTGSWDAGIFSPPLVDFCLVGSDGGQIRAHKAVLAGKSKIFKAMLTASMSECVHAKVVISDMTAQELRPFVNFLYTGCISRKNLEKHAVALFAASDKYDIPLLKSICEHFLELNASINVLGTFELAKTYNSKTLQKAVLPYLFREEFIKENSAAVVVKAFREASTFEGYKEYRKKQPRKIAYLMEVSVHRIAGSS
eukprot:Gb_40017 [translate_table: standard]